MADAAMSQDLLHVIQIRIFQCLDRVQFIFSTFHIENKHAICQTF